MTMKRRIVPLGDRILVKLKPIQKTGLIELLDDTTAANQRATQEAYVVAVGPMAWKMIGDGTPWAKVGDLVKILKYSGDDDKTIEDGCIYRVISDEDLLAAFPDESLKDE